MVFKSEPKVNQQAPAQTSLSAEETEKRPKVLVIEDEGGIRRLLRFCLEERFAVVEAATADEGIDAASRCRADAVLLDMSLPDMEGMAVLKRLREWSQVPILVLSESAVEADKMRLDSGANDYITKPFSTDELLARLRVTQRYSKLPPPVPVFRSGDLMVDLASRTVRVKGKRAKLTPTEYSLLRLFVQNAGKVLTHRQIFREIWGTAEPDNIGYIRVYLTSLRNKLARELIVTEPGIGYRLALQE